MGDLYTAELMTLELGEAEQQTHTQCRTQVTDVHSFIPFSGYLCLGLREVHPGALFTGVN